MKKVIKRLLVTFSCILVCAAVIVFATSSSERLTTTEITPHEFKTVSEIQNYITAANTQNDQLIDTNLDKVMSTITFSEAITGKELAEFVETYDITIAQIQARGFDKSGNRITFFSRTDKGIIESVSELEKTATRTNIEFAGIIGMYSYVNSEYVKDIQNYEKTLLIDTSSDGFFGGHTSSSTYVRNGIDATGKRENAFTHSIAWKAEDLGLVDYQETIKNQ